MFSDVTERDIDDRRRRILQAVAASGVSVALAGCSSRSTPDDSFEAQGPGDRAWITGTTSGAQSLNPLAVSDEATNNRLNLLYDPGSVTVDGLEFEGRMLADYEISSDSKSATYVLRDDLEWGAGYGQVTADDYISFVNDIVFGGGVVGYSQTSSYVLGGEQVEIEKLGKLEFRLNLPESRGYWLVEDPLRTARPLPQSLIEKYKPFEKREVNGNQATVLTQIGQDEAVVNAELSGNLGPFNYESWEKGQKLVVSKNDDYYLAGEKIGGLGEAGPHTDDYTYQVFDEQSTAYSAARAGDITSTGVEGRKVDEVSQSDGIQVFETEFGEGTFFLSLNHRVNGWRPIRESREVRQAFAHLIDKNVLVDQIFDGFGDSISTFHERWGPFYPDEVPEFETSLELAQEKFANGAGSDYGYDGDTYVGPDGEQVELTLVINNTSQTAEIVGNYVKQQLGQVGIATNIEGGSFDNLLSNYLAADVQNNPNYDGDPSFEAGRYNGGAYDEAIGQNSYDLLYGVGFSGNPFSPWGTIKSLLPEQANFNFMGYNPDFDIEGTVNDAATASGQEETQEIMTELFTFLANEQPLTWLFNPHDTIAYRRGVDNLPDPDSFWDTPGVRTNRLTTME
ncbi:MAG: bacterial extracellular solute-binding protein [Haloquadratum sp. J07HQX50]|nr:MAG: bacterial extracellular solute-binding protein [Haloquadratum sp. J07HQX50]